MATPLIDNLVHETSTTTGTGNFTLSNANGKRSFNTAFSTGGTDKFYYFISHQSAAEYEWGTGHLSASSTLVRDTVIGGSNGTSAVNFSAGTKDVTCDIIAAKQINLLDLAAGDGLSLSGTTFSINTNNALGIASITLAHKTNSGTVASGSTTAGSNLTVGGFDASGAYVSEGVALSGTQRNMSGWTCPGQFTAAGNHGGQLWMRTA